MAYLPRELLRDPENEERVHNILEDFNQDLVPAGQNLKEEAIKQLEALGEDRVIEGLKSGLFSTVP